MKLSQSSQYVNYGMLNKIDVAIVEGLAVTEEGHIIPTTAVGNAPTFIKNADKVIVEINLLKPMSLEGMSDIVITDKTRPLGEVDEVSRKISDNIIKFFDKEVAQGRLTNSLLPLQSGVGSVANAVLYGLCDSEYENLTCYTEVVQDSMLDLLRSGKAVMASTTALRPSPAALELFIK